MKVGILTFHRAHNYGAFLQAFALKSYIESLGNEVVFIDYEDKNHHSLYRLFGPINEKNKKRNLFSIIKSLIKQIILFIPRYRRYIRFQKEIESKLGIKGSPIFNPEKLSDDCDIYVYGSDQIWRKDNYVGGFVKVFWGEYPITKAKKIAYAASMGKLVSKDEDKEWIKLHLKNFSQISVREEHLKTFIQQLNNKIEVETVCDPTLLLDKKVWIEKFNLKKTKGDRFLFFYHLLKSEKAKIFIDNIQKEKECKVIEITGEVIPIFLKQNLKQDIGPKEFLEYLYNADIVISTSFHGVVFSLIFEKEFYAMGMDSNNTRVLSLLEKVGLTNRYIKDNDNLPTFEDKIDYNIIRDKLRDYTFLSKEFIKCNI